MQKNMGMIANSQDQKDIVLVSQWYTRTCVPWNMYHLVPGTSLSSYAVVAINHSGYMGVGLVDM